MNKVTLAGIALLLASCAPTLSEPDYGKITQEIEAYQPAVAIENPEADYVAVENASTGAIEQSLDSLATGSAYNAVFSRPGYDTAVVPFTLTSGQVAHVKAPVLNALTAMKSGPYAKITLTNYNIQNFYLLFTKDGKAVRSVSQLPPEIYQWFVVRSGYNSAPTPLYLGSETATEIPIPTVQDFALAVVATIRSSAVTTGSYSGGSTGGTVHVSGYTNSHGTYVAPYYRSSPHHR